MSPVKMKPSLPSFVYDASDEDKLTLLKAFMAEYLCMTLFLAFTIGTISSNCHTADIAAGSGAVDKSLVGTEFGNCMLAESRLFTIAAAFGFSIFVLVYVAASFSGGHLNPAVTIGLLTGRKISLFRALLYIIAQVLGACTGAGLIKAIDPNGWNAAGGGTNALSPGITDAGGWGLETVLTFTLVFVVFAATDAERATDTAHLPVLAPFAIGMDVFLCHMVAIPLDGCSINPARSFGASAVAGVWKNHWVFWVGPLSGAVLAGLIYDWFFRTGASKSVALDVDGVQPQVTAALPAFAGAEGLQESKNDAATEVNAGHVANKNLAREV